MKFFLILALIIVPLVIFQGVREKHAKAMRRQVYANQKVKATLRGLITSQEIAFKNAGTYASDVGTLERFESYPEVTVRIAEASAKGWSAEATTPDADGSCVMFVGAATPPRTKVGATATDQGSPLCDTDR